MHARCPDRAPLPSSRRPSRAALGLWALALLAACDGEDDLDGAPSVPSSMDAGTGDAASSSDAATMDAGMGDAALGDTSPGDVGALAIQAEPETWTWVPFPESRCMNDTPTGIGVNLLTGATRAVLFLQGGNACFNGTSCSITANPDGYGETQFRAEITSANALRASFDRDAPQNPFADASYVYVPYCTGDVHAGTRAEPVMLGGRPRVFLGHRNLERYLDRLVPTLAGVTEVLLVGVSAGGFGAAVNFDLVQRRFGPEVRVTLLDDSGPPMGSEFVAPCLQQHFRTLWGLDAGPLASCEACRQGTDGTFMEPYVRHLLAAWPDRTFAFASYEGDQVIRGFWGYGENGCAALESLLPLPYSADKFRNGMIDLRDRILADAPRAGVWLSPGTSHVILTMVPWMVMRDGVTFASWIQGALDGDPAWTSVPRP